MKKITLIILVCLYMITLSVTLFAQPVITSSDPLQAVGTIDTIYSASATVSPGAGGAGITWDLSALSFSPGGTATIANPSTSPYISTFPTSNLCLQLTAGGTAYDYDRVSTTGWETISTTYAGPGTGQDYSANTRLEMPFPFHYLDVAVDTYQQTTGGPQVETLTYDGYGTLITPYHIYTNVFRVKEDYGGTDYHYSWYTVNPLMLLMNYSNAGNNYIYLNTVPVTTQSGQVNIDAESAKIIPNPFSTDAKLKLTSANAFTDASLIIVDPIGNVVKQIPVNGTETIITRQGLSAGVYFYHVQNNGLTAATGKLVIQ